MPLVPCTGIFLGPSKSGKTVALISLILEQYKGVFERIYIFSPSINIDDSWIPVKKYIEEDLGVNTEREQAYWDAWDEAALRRIIQQQRKITETSKKLEMKKLYQVLIICDDMADMPQLHKANGALDTLFIRGRHSTWVSSQKLRLISAAVRVNIQFLCCWRLRNQHELDAVVEELSALLLKEQLYQLYEQATREPYSFLFVYYLKSKKEVFYKRFEERFVIENAGGSGAQLPGPEAVRQLHYFFHFILRGAVWPQHRALAVAGTQHPVQVTFTVATNRGRRQRGPRTSPENKQPHGKSARLGAKHREIY